MKLLKNCVIGFIFGLALMFVLVSFMTMIGCGTQSDVYLNVKENTDEIVA